MKRGGAAVVLLALLGGCVQPARVPQDSYYRMADPVEVRAAAGRLEGALVVPRLLADGLTSERALLYARANSPQVLKQTRYHFWSESPTRMIQERVVDYLRRARLADTVVTPEFRAAADYELIGRIKRLELLRGPSPQAVVALEFGLFRVHDRRLLHLQTYEQVVPLEGEDIGGAAAALGAAVLSILSRLTGDLSAL